MDSADSYTVIEPKRIYDRDIDCLSRLIHQSNVTCTAVHLQGDELIIAGNRNYEGGDRASAESIFKVFRELASAPDKLTKYKDIESHFLLQAQTLYDRYPKMFPSSTRPTNVQEFLDLYDKTNASQDLTSKKNKIREICQPLLDCRRAGYELMANPKGEFATLLQKRLQFLTNPRPTKHAEVRILEHLHSARPLRARDNIPIGVSKLACAPCDIAVQVLKENNITVVLPGTHGKVYFSPTGAISWNIPDLGAMLPAARVNELSQNFNTRDLAVSSQLEASVPDLYINPRKGIYDHGIFAYKSDAKFNKAREEARQRIEKTEQLIAKVQVLDKVKSELEMHRAALRSFQEKELKIQQNKIEREKYYKTLMGPKLMGHPAGINESDRRTAQKLYEQQNVDGAIQHAMSVLAKKERGGIKDAYDKVKDNKPEVLDKIFQEEKEGLQKQFLESERKVKALEEGVGEARGKTLKQLESSLESLKDNYKSLFLETQPSTILDTAHQQELLGNDRGLHHSNSTATASGQRGELQHNTMEYDNDDSLKEALGVGNVYYISSSNMEKELKTIIIQAVQEAEYKPPVSKPIVVNVNGQHYAGAIIKKDGKLPSVYFTDPISESQRSPRPPSKDDVGYPNFQQVFENLSKETGMNFYALNTKEGPGGKCGAVLVDRLQKITQATESFDIQQMTDGFSSYDSNGNPSAAEQQQFEEAIRLSLEDAQEKGKIGPRDIRDWGIKEVKDDGNCFYDAVADQLERLAPSTLQECPSETEKHVFVRGRVQGIGFQDREWADQTNIANFTKEFNVAVAIMDTKQPEKGFYLLVHDGKQVETVPEGTAIVRLASTGNHFMSVHSNPELKDGKLRGAYTIGNDDSLKQHQGDRQYTGLQALHDSIPPESRSRHPNLEQVFSIVNVGTRVVPPTTPRVKGKDKGQNR